MRDRPPRRHDKPNTGGKGDNSRERSRGIARGVRIVFEDDDILVVDKPCGMLSAYVGGPRGEGYEGDDLFSLVKKYVRENTRSRTRTRNRAPVFVVHRLDREVSGLMVFAKSDRALHWLKEDLRARRVHRVYHAVVEGEIPITGPGSSGTVQSFLRETPKGLVESCAPPPKSPGASGRRDVQQREDEDKGPKLAITHWRAINTGRGHSLLQIRLETGRKNQIRVHMKDLGHPISGDRKYGSTEDPIGRVCLHAGELAFSHAFTGQAVRLKSPLPREFFKIVGAGRDEAAQIDGEGDSQSHSPTQAAPVAPKPNAPRDAGWDHVAEWYDKMIEEGKSDHFERVIIPGALRLLEPKANESILDVACGQGAFCRLLASLGAAPTGIDFSPRLIESARRSSEQAGARCTFDVGDARELEHKKLAKSPFSSVCCLMALMNIDPLSPVFTGIHTHLRPGGKFVAVILHPSFRATGQTSWAWETGASQPPDASRRVAPKLGGKRPFGPDRHASSPSPRADRQYRRVDGYLSPGHSEIVMNPGAASSGAERVVTITHHRPLQTYIRLLAEAGFVIDALEEWPSARQSQPGPRAAEENRARREIPMFLAFRARRL